MARKKSKLTEDGKILIKKYGNRRLYSTEESKYLTLEELEELVREGKDVKIIDASTEADLTSQVLTQILVEGGKAKSIPVNFLEKVIRQSDDVLQSLFQKQGEYMEKGMSTALKNQKDMMEMYQNFLKMGSMWPNPFMGFPGFPNPTDQTPKNEKEHDKEEIEDLKKRLADLEGKLSKK